MRILLFGGLFFTATQLYAQDRTPSQNRQLWFWLQFTKQLPKKFSIGFQYQLRLGNNMTKFTGENFYANLGYKINKYVSTSFTYQFFTSNKVNNHTFFFSLTGKYRYRDFTVGVRTAYQYVTEYFSRRYDPGHEPVHELRNRLFLKYAVASNWTVYAYCEPYLFFDPKYNSRGIWVDKIRNLVGVDWQVYKYNTIGLFYFFQPEFTGKRPEYQHVVGLVYDFDLPKKVNWKKFFHPKKGKRKKSDEETPDTREKDKLYD